MPSTFWNDLKNTLKTGFNVAAEKTEEYTKIGKLKVDIMNLKRTLDKHYTDLGKEAFELINKGKEGDFSTNAKVKGFVGKIKELSKTIKDKDAEIEKIKAEHAKKEADKKKEGSGSEKPKNTAAAKSKSTASAKPKTGGKTAPKTTQKKS